MGMTIYRSTCFLDSSFWIGSTHYDWCSHVLMLLFPALRLQRSLVLRARPFNRESISSPFGLREEEIGNSLCFFGSWWKGWNRTWGCVSGEPPSGVEAANETRAEVEDEACQQDTASAEEALAQAEDEEEGAMAAFQDAFAGLELPLHLPICNLALCVLSLNTYLNFFFACMLLRLNNIDFVYEILMRCFSLFSFTGNSINNMIIQIFKFVHVLKCLMISFFSSKCRT